MALRGPLPPPGWVVWAEEVMVAFPLSREASDWRGVCVCVGRGGSRTSQKMLWSHCVIGTGMGLATDNMHLTVNEVRS